MTQSLGNECGPHWWEASALALSNGLLSFSQLTFEQFPAILGGKIISDVRDGKFYWLPLEKENIACHPYYCCEKTQVTSPTRVLL